MRCNRCRTEKNYLLSNVKFNNKGKTFCIECLTAEMYDDYKDKQEVIIIDNTEKKEKIGVIKWLKKEV